MIEDHVAQRPRRAAPVYRTSVIPSQTVDMMRRMLPAQTDKCLQETFGISWTVWMKVRNGRPIRHSTAERLIERINAKLSDQD